MKTSFDSRIVPADVVRFLLACQRTVPFHLGGGAALAGVHLRHRLSNDADLFVHDRHAHRELVQALPALATESGAQVKILRDGGAFVRGTLDRGDSSIDLDVIFEPVPDLDAPAVTVEGIAVESLTDLRVNKLTCLLSRSEPRDLVDLLFLDRAGYPPEADLPLALRKDAGTDPGVLAWLLSEFPVEPLPIILEHVTVEELRRFRDELRERFRRLAVPPPA